jgi:ribosomal protein S18 acetylase RimI-like enzyme
MSIEIIQATPSELPAYATIPTVFYAENTVDIKQSDNGAFIFIERKLDAPYMKDYDSIMSPTTWKERFDLSAWCFFLAFENNDLVGGTAIAAKNNDVGMLEGREDLAVLWDIRVLPERRGTGIGSKLFRISEEWSRKNGLQELKIETQNNNLPAIRFYQKHGCTLRHINPFAYPEFPDEVQLLWYKDLVH